MTDELNGIDRSAIEQLVKIRTDEQVLRERLARMEENKANVSPVVYERVKGDYKTRLDSLLAGATPLKDVARREYARLKTLDANYRKALQDVTLEKEELEFRRQLGEYGEDEFATKVNELDRRIGEQQARVDAAALMKAEFLGAFSSESDLETASTASAQPPKPATQPAAERQAPPAPLTAPPPTPAAATPPPPAAAPPAPAPAPAAPSTPAPASAPPAAAATPAPAGPTPAPAASATPAPEFNADATMVAPPTSPAPMPDIPPPPMVSTKTTEAGGSTVIFTMPKLIAVTNGQPAEEYVLNAKTSIGRTSKNDIQVLEDSVSRSHCEVVLASDGYRIVDLGSHNGVSVNGMRVTDRLLTDGDVIQVGTRQFVFRG